MIKRVGLAAVIFVAVSGCGGATTSNQPAPAPTVATTAPTPTLSTSLTSPTAPASSASSEPSIGTFSDGFSWSDGVEVSVTTITHARMTRQDVEDSDPEGKVGEPLVRFQLRVKNGSDGRLSDLSGESTVSYGPDGTQAPQRFPVNQAYEELGSIQPGKAKTITQTYALPIKYQDEVTLEFDLDGDHETATFSGSVK